MADWARAGAAHINTGSSTNRLPELIVAQIFECDQRITRHSRKIIRKRLLSRPFRTHGATASVYPTFYHSLLCYQRTASAVTQHRERVGRPSNMRYHVLCDPTSR